MKDINLFWYSNYKFENLKSFSKKKVKKILGLEVENYGDLMSRYLIAKISNQKVKWYNPRTVGKKRNYFAIGSIINFCNSESVVWGSGIINTTHHISSADFRAVRGPYTKRRLEELGIYCPTVFGDPALLMPLFYKPQVVKKYKLGVIPHFTDYLEAKRLFKDYKDILVINPLTRNIERTTKEILCCERSISSSLHGLIISHAYSIPSIWVEFSKKPYGDGVKFLDYLESVEIPVYLPLSIQNYFSNQSCNSFFENFKNFPENGKIMDLQKGLLLTCPFAINNSIITTSTSVLN